MVNKFFKLLVLFSALIYIGAIVALFSPLETCLKKPITQYDYAFHYTNIIKNANRISHNLSDHGYNPYIGAGQVESQGVSNRIILPFKLILNQVPSNLIFNLLIFIILLLIPFLVAYASKLYYPKNQSFLIHFMGTALFIIGTDIGQEFVYIGHFGFLLSISLSVLAGAYFHNFLECNRIRALLLQSILVGLALWTHPFTPIILFSSYLVLIIHHRKKLSLKRSCSIIASLFIFGLIPNIFWIKTFLEYLIQHHNTFELAEYLQTTAKSLYSLLLEPIIVLTLLFFISSLIPFHNFKPSATRMIFIPTLVVLLIISLTGSSIGLNDLQPLRFIIPAYIFALLSISITRTSISTVLYGLLIIIGAIIGIKHSNYLNTHGCGFADKHGRKLFQFIEKNLNKEQRLHIEVANFTPYYRTRITSLIPNQYNIPVMANPLPYPVAFHHFFEGKIFGKPIEQHSIDQFQTYSNLYNIGYFLVYRNKTFEYFNQFSQFKKIYDDGIAKIYSITTSNSSYCYDCNAQVNYSRLALTIDNISQDDLILKFYYHHSLTVSGSAKIEPVYLHDDPNPFIRLKANGAVQVTIKYTEL